jgi:hypothetical protein
MDWTRTRHERFEYLRLSKAGAHLGPLDGVTGGTISENLNTALKVSGTLTIAGEADLGDERVRVSLVAEQDGTVTEVVLGTFLVSTPSRERLGPDVVTSVELYSTLLILADDKLEETLTVAAGTEAVGYARTLVEAAGLSAVVTPQETPSETTVDAVFEAGKSMLEVVNGLLGFAGYRSADVDAYGSVVLEPYAEVAGRLPAWTFADGDASIFIPPVTDALDWYGTPNVVVVVSTNAETAMTAVSENDDPASALSTVSRGRRIVRYEEVSDIESQEALQARADLLLVSSARNVNIGTVRHTFAPIATGDVVRLHYAQAGVDYLMVVQSKEMQLVAGVPTTTAMRRFV